MATRIQKPLIPSTFVRLDSEVSDPDEFLNVHTMQTARANHNILMARRVKRTLFSQSFDCRVTPATASNRLKMDVYTGASRLKSAVIFDCPLYLTRSTQSIVVHGFARKERNYTAGSLYPVVIGPQDYVDIDTSNEIALTNSTTTWPEFTKSVDVPLSCKSTGIGRLMIFAEGQMNTSTKFSGTAITDVGPQWIDVGGAAAVGDVLTFSNADIEPRIVVSVVGNRAYVDKPWNIDPIIGTDTVSGYLSQTIAIGAIGAYEEVVTDFFKATATK